MKNIQVSACLEAIGQSEWAYFFCFIYLKFNLNTFVNV